jgi:hypothetical protein
MPVTVPGGEGVFVIGSGVMVGIKVGVDVRICVGICVAVDEGVTVGPNAYPGPQPEINTRTIRLESNDPQKLDTNGNNFRGS